MNAYRLLVEYPEGQRLLGRSRRGEVDNIKMDHGEIRWGDMDWIGLVQDKEVEGSCECGNKLSGFIKYRKVLEWLHNWWPPQ
jgi:hypothetical protein